MSAASRTAEVISDIAKSIDQLSKLKPLCVNTVNRDGPKLLSMLTDILQRAEHEDNVGSSPIESDQTSPTQSPESQQFSRECTPNGSIFRSRSSIATPPTRGSRSSIVSKNASCRSGTRVEKCQPQRPLGTFGEHASDYQSNDGSQLESRSEISHSPSREGRKRRHDEFDKSQRLEETFEKIVKTFGMESDLETLEDMMNNAHDWRHEIPAIKLAFIRPTPNPVELFQALSNIVGKLEENELAEMLLPVHKRIELAYFHLVYERAQMKASIFIAWTESIHQIKGIPLTPNRGQTNSVVKQRFIDIYIGQSRKSREQLSRAIDNWRTCGKPWAKLILRFGYGGLLLVPNEMTNDYVNKLPQDEFTHLLNAIEARKPLFAATLENATKIMKTMFQHRAPPATISKSTPQPVPTQSMQKVSGTPVGLGYPPRYVDPSMIMLK